MLQAGHRSIGCITPAFVDSTRVPTVLYLPTRYPVTQLNVPSWILMLERLLLCYTFSDTCFPRLLKLSQGKDGSC